MTEPTIADRVAAIRRLGRARLVTPEFEAAVRRATAQRNETMRRFAAQVNESLRKRRSTHGAVAKAVGGEGANP